jgi:hypothetical protein
MKRLNTSFSVIVTSHEDAKRSVHSLHGWLQLHYKKCSLSSWLVTVTIKEVFTLFMAGYSYTKRSVIVTSHEESEHFF